MSAISAPTNFITTRLETYAFRRFGSGGGLPLLFLQHFTGTLDNWDPAVTDALAEGREVILFENAGIGRSSGAVPNTVADMAAHAFAFVDALGIAKCDVLGFSLGGMIAQQMVLDRPSVFRRMVLVATAPPGGEDIMHLEKPSLAKYFGNPQLKGYRLLQRIFFAPTETSQAAGAAFVDRLMLRQNDREPPSGPNVAQAQIAAFRDWEGRPKGNFEILRSVTQPTLIVNGVGDEMIPVRNSYWLSANLANAVLMTYPDSGHGALFQFHQAFAGQVAAFLRSNSESAPY